MKQLNLSIDFEAEGINLGSTKPEDVFSLLFGQMFDTAHPQGMTFRDGHKAFKIFQKLDLMRGQDVLDLEDDEFEFLKDAATRGRFSVQQNKVAHIIYRLLGLL